MNKTYYDGPVKNTDRSLEELEKDIQKEKERCEKLNSYDIYKISEYASNQFASGKYDEA